MEPEALIPVGSDADVATAAPEEQLIPVGVTNTPSTPELPQSVVRLRTAKASFGLDKPYQDVNRAIVTGSEDTYRVHTAAERDTRVQQEINKQIYDYAQTKGGPLTSDEIRQIKSRVSMGEEFTHPKAVFEAAYSKKFVTGALYQDLDSDSNSWYSQILKEVPQADEKATFLGTDYATKLHIVDTHLENARAVLQRQSTAGYITDLAKNFFSLGLYGEAKSRGNIPGVGFLSGLAGTNLEQQRIQAFRLPANEFADTISKIADQKIRDNPTDAVEWLTAMRGNLDKDAANLGSLITLATAPGVGTAIKTTARAAKALSMLGKATEDAVVASTSTLPPKVAQAVGAGNIPEAAVQIATTTLIKEKDGLLNPADKAVGGLPNILREKAELLKENPGTGPGAQEITNRLYDAAEKSAGRFENLVTNWQRVNRTPAALATEDGVRLYKEDLKAQYRGPDSSILAIEGPFHHIETNTRYFELKLAQPSGELWNNPETAANAMRGKVTLKGQADAARQLELQRLIKQTEYELDTTRKVQSLSKRGGDAAADLRIKLGISKQTQRPDFEAYLKSLESNYAKYTKELDDLRALPGATIEQQGTKFYVSKFEPFRETEKVTRSQLLTTPESRSPTGYLGSFTAKFRTGEETASADNQALAKQAIYGKNKLIELAKIELEPIRKLGRWTIPGTERRKQYQQLLDTIKAGRTEGLAKSYGELEHYYLTHYNRRPAPAEADAYFAYTRYGQLQDMLTSIDLYTMESRVGTKMHSIQTLDANGNPTSSGFIKGISRPELPKEGNGILLMGERLGDERIVNAASLKKNQTITQGIKEGRWKVIEIVHHNENPLKNFGNQIGENYVKYVVAPNIEEAPLRFTRVERNGGGLWDLDHPFYIAQAKVLKDEPSKTYRYKGDNHLMPIESGKLGRDIVDLLEQVRGHLKANNEEAAKQVALKLPMEFRDIKSWFNPRSGPDGRSLPPHFDVDQPFRVVPANKQIVNLDERLEKSYTDLGHAFRDDTRGNIVNQNLIKGQHDPYQLYTIKDVGSRQNPIYHYEPATYIDPIPSMNRGLKRIADSVYMDDYKLFAVEHWIQEYGKHLDTPGPNSLANAPMYYFYHGKFRNGTPIDVQKRALDSKAKAEQIWGTPSKLETQVEGIAQYMADTIYGKLGPKAGAIPMWAFSATKDVGGFIKAATFHTTIGLFAWPQFLVQNMTWATIAGLEGVGHASSGAAAALAHMFGRINPHAVDFLDNVMTKIPVPSISGRGLVRWKPGEFKEAHKLLNDTGFYLVGSEHGLLDNPMSTKVIANGRDQFLDAGTWFFREAEKNVRAGAWYTAYRKFRDVHPTGALTDADIREIVNRADLLAGNMSAASKSSLQRGPLSFATQFLSYNMRMAELFTGKRITGVERARLFATYWGLFGVSAAGLSGLPIGDWMRNKAIEHGYTAEPGAYSTWAMEGVPAAFIQMATGKLYGIGQRYGSVGFDPIRDILSGDKPTWQLAVGASGSLIKNAWDSTDGFRSALLSIAKNDDVYFKLKPTDFLEPLKIASSGNQAHRYAAALSTMNWLNRRGQIVDTDISPLNASIMTLTGVQEQGHYDIFAKRGLETERRDMISSTEEKFLKEWRRYSQAVVDKNYAQANDYGSRAWAILIANDYPMHKYADLAARAERENQSLKDRGDFTYYTRNVPQSDVVSKQEAYTKTLQQKEKNK